MVGGDGVSNDEAAMGFRYCAAPALKRPYKEFLTFTYAYRILFRSGYNVFPKFYVLPIRSVGSRGNSEIRFKKRTHDFPRQAL